MKIALYIEDSLEQIVLTPESDTEKGILGKLHDGSRTLGIKQGTFYACRGGWTRWAEPGALSTLGERDKGESTIIVLTAETPHTEGGE